MKLIKFVIILIAIFTLLVTLACSITPMPTPGPVSPSEPPASEETAPPTEPPVPLVLKIIYIKSGDVWIWTEGGSPQQVTFGGGASSPRLSRDGSLVAFERGNELWVINHDGSGEHRLVDQAFLSSYAPSPTDTVVPHDMFWMADTHSLVFNTLVITAESGFQIPLMDYKAADAVTGITFTTSEGEGGVAYPSPDGTMIAFAQPDRVLLRTFPSGGPATTVITFPHVYTYSEWFYVPILVWMPDSSAIRLVVPPQDPFTNPSEPSVLWNVPVTGSPTPLTSFVAEAAFSSQPLVSPDGQKVVYVVNNGSNTEIHVITATGSDSLMLSFPLNSVHLLGWHPDAARFLFAQPDVLHAKLGTSGSFQPLGDTPRVQRIRWIDEESFVFMNENELRLSDIVGASTLLDTAVTEYDLVWVSSE